MRAIETYDENYKKACNAYQQDPQKWKAQLLPNYKNPKSPEETSLHLFISFFKKDWTAKKKEAMPFCTPYFQYIPTLNKPEKHEAFCRAKLLQFKPGANPKNVLGDFETYRDCLQDFMKNSIHCPPFLEKDFLDSLDESNSKDREETGETLESDDEFEELDFDQLDSGPEALVDLGITNEMKILQEIHRATMFADFHADAEYLDAIDDECNYDNEDIVEKMQDHDWCSDYKDLNLDEQSIKIHRSWITDMKLLESETTEDEIDLSDVNADSLNEKQSMAFELIKNWIDNIDDVLEPSAQLLLQIQGKYWVNIC